MNNFSNDFSADGFDEAEDDSVYDSSILLLQVASGTRYSISVHCLLFEHRFNFADPDASSHFQSVHDDVCSFFLRFCILAARFH